MLHRPVGQALPDRGRRQYRRGVAGTLAGRRRPGRHRPMDYEKRGKSGTETGHFRLGAYCPAPDGRTTAAWSGRRRRTARPPAGRGPRRRPAIIAAMRKAGIVAHLECSGSGTGWHVWIFFETGVPAAKVRRLLLASACRGTRRCKREGSPTPPLTAAWRCSKTGFHPGGRTRQSGLAAVVERSRRARQPLLSGRTGRRNRRLRPGRFRDRCRGGLDRTGRPTRPKGESEADALTYQGATITDRDLAARPVGTEPNPRRRL